MQLNCKETNVKKSFQNTKNYSQLQKPCTGLKIVPVSKARGSPLNLTEMVMLDVFWLNHYDFMSTEHKASKQYVLT